LGEKLVVFVKFEKGILRTYDPRMTGKGWLTSIIELVILQPEKNILFLLNLLPDVYLELTNNYFDEKLIIFRRLNKLRIKN